MIIRMPSNITPVHTEYLAAMVAARPKIGEKLDYYGQIVEVITEPVDITGPCIIYKNVEMPSFRFDARFPDGAIKYCYSNKLPA
jgi:hypothetical protein